MFWVGVTVTGVSQTSNIWFLSNLAPLSILVPMPKGRVPHLRSMLNRRSQFSAISNGSPPDSHWLYIHSVRFSVIFNQFQSASVSLINLIQFQSVWLCQKRRNLFTTGRWGKQHETIIFKLITMKINYSGKSKWGLSKRGLGSKGAHWDKKGLFRQFLLFPRGCGVRRISPDQPRKGPGAEKAHTHSFNIPWEREWLHN